MTNTREDLGFRRAVLDSFRFLVEEYGLQCTKEKPTLVQYESDTVAVRVYHGRRSRELDVEFIDLDSSKDTPPLRLFDVLQLEGKADQMPQGFFQSSQPTGVRNLVGRLAELTREYAGEVLLGNRMYLRRLSVSRAKIATQEERSREAVQLRHQAELAWRSEDYSKVAELLEELEEPLTPAEKKKLKMARRRAGH